ncbi:MAG TPA: hypothetical protein VEC12_12915, partial [Bacteroidia bacterium]|nr:hypothetical protein [Bacteroidia bacterium]
MITDNFRRYKLDHLIFWLFYVLFWLVVSGSLSQPWQVLNTFIVVFFHALVSYFNIYVLIPLF